MQGRELWPCGDTRAHPAGYQNTRVRFLRGGRTSPSSQQVRGRVRISNSYHKLLINKLTELINKKAASKACRLGE